MQTKGAIIGLVGGAIIGNTFTSGHVNGTEVMVKLTGGPRVHGANALIRKLHCTPFITPPKKYAMNLNLAVVDK